MRIKNDRSKAKTRQTISADENSPKNRRLNSSIFSSQEHQISLYSFIGIFSVLTTYVFLISVGTWINWPAATTYYDQLAKSFRHGKLSLEEMPDPALLALPNPYDPETRAGIPYPKDISLYDGKFYLYFGPTPALILTFVKSFYSGEIGDQYLVFVFASGILLFQSLLIIKLWRRFFSDIPPWLILSSILIIGLISPFGWILSLATIYNASILGGQFFFLAGLYTAFIALDAPSISKLKLTFTGFFWVCAIGSRMTQIIPISFMLVMVLTWIVLKNLHQNRSSKSLIAFLSIGIPVCIGAIGLGWYNWARFDSIFEFGTTYQLAGPDLQKHQQKLFSPLYVANNIYNYFLIKPDISNKFPFLGPVKGHNESVIRSIDLPNIYFSQETVGLFYSAPFILFAIVSIIATLKILSKGPKLFNEGGDFSFNWMLISLFVSFLSSLLFFLFFFWAGVRYQADFMPSFAIFSVIGFWQAYRHIANHPFWLILFIATALGLIATTIINSNLIAMSINSAQYRALNPALWKHLTKFFGN